MGRGAPGAAGSKYAHTGAARRSFRSDRAATRWGIVTCSSLPAASPPLDLLACLDNHRGAFCGPGTSDSARSLLDALVYRAPGDCDGLFARTLATSTGH